MTPATNSGLTTIDYSIYEDGLCLKDDIKLKAGRLIVPLYILVFLIGFIGNSLVILILIKYKKLRTMTDVYLLNLAISDLFFVFSLPFWAYYILYDWIFGNTLCKLFSGIYLIGFYGASLFIILLTLDRYLAIVHAVFAMKTRTIKFGIITSILLWMVAILASLPGFIFSEVEQKMYVACSPNYPHRNWMLFDIFEMNILGLVIPLVVMIFCYTRIVCTLLRCRSEKKKTKAVKLIFIILIMFLLFWLPYNVVLILIAFQDSEILNNCETSKRLDEAIQWTEAMSFFHCCLNPIIYAFAGEKFRKYLCIFLHQMLPNWHFCPFMHTHIQTYDRHSSLYTSSTGEQDISAVL
ncbi:C-C chemokine receptor type 5-like [Spea bombifrons]|uniref:C-C chemokine receptor type 5-like n=1 Tax=Spea bombifrons TaxID=233779 RepID=UPI00234B8A03|nr:C-C chemokine receptor type 5-like [Spea bombifrons]